MKDYNITWGYKDAEGLCLTQCEICKDNEIIAVGRALQSCADVCNKETGRKISLERALLGKTIPKETFEKKFELNEGYKDATKSIPEERGAMEFLMNKKKRASIWNWYRTLTKKPRW